MADQICRSHSYRFPCRNVLQSCLTRISDSMRNETDGWRRQLLLSVCLCVCVFVCVCVCVCVFVCACLCACVCVSLCDDQSIEWFKVSFTLFNLRTKLFVLQTPKRLNVHSQVTFAFFFDLYHFKAHSHQTKAKTKAKTFFDVWIFFFDLFCWFFGLFHFRSMWMSPNSWKYKR